MRLIWGIVIDYGYYPNFSREVMAVWVCISFIFFLNRNTVFFSHCSSSLGSDESATVFAPVKGVPIHQSTEEGARLRSAPASVHWTPVYEAYKAEHQRPSSIYHFSLTLLVNSRNDDSSALSDAWYCKNDLDASLLLYKLKKKITFGRSQG